MRPEDNDRTPRDAAPPHTLLDGSIVSRELARTAWDAPLGGVHAHESDAGDADEALATKAKTCKPTRNPCCKPTQNCDAAGNELDDDEDEDEGAGEGDLEGLAATKVKCRPTRNPVCKPTQKCPPPPPTQNCPPPTQKKCPPPTQRCDASGRELGDDEG